MDFSQFVSDLVATIVGVGLGVWGALWLDRRSIKRSENLRKLEKSARAKIVLGLVKSELEENFSALKKMDDLPESNYARLQVESWKAFSDGGELQWIDDPKVLRIVSIAYAQVKHFMLLYDKFFDMKFFPGKNAYEPMKNILHNITMKYRQDSIEAVQSAITEISDRLQTL